MMFATGQPIAIPKMNRNGMIFSANFVITPGSAICCVIATAVTGEAAGVAIAN